MKRFLRLLTALVLLPLPSLRAEISLEEGIQSHLGKLSADSLPGMAVLVARDGKIIYQGGFGFADLGQKKPVTAGTRFRIGSVTKQFTAAAILRLADEGKLALADPLEKYFAGFPAGVTLDHLLTHTSGIHSYTDKPEFLGRVAKPIAPEDLIAWFRGDPPDFEPGKGFHYNNSAYFLLGEIVAKVSGKTLAACLEEMFFAPLGMRDSGIYQNATPPPGAAAGYSIVEGKPGPALDWDMSWAGGAGAMFSTVGDLHRWNEALFGGKVLKPESFKAMITPVKLAEGVDGMNYGYGLMISESRRLPVIGHGGGLNGWSSELIRLPEQKCTVVALANALPPVAGFEPAAVTRQIAGKLLEAEIRKLPPLAEDPTVDKKRYPDFVGRYDYKNAVLTVSVEGGGLHAQLTGQPKFEIFPSAPDAFFWKVTDAEVVFQRDAGGKVVAARHRQGGNSFTAPRITAAALELTEAELDAILGRYQYGPAAVLTVSRDGTAVFAQLTGQPKLRIHPKSATEFEWREVEASVTFKKDDTGKVTGVTHRQNGATFDATGKVTGVTHRQNGATFDAARIED
jgi:CubicO group peptidase (beta-lactamase class C family)